ncbi:hypothetical protein HP15_p187g20 (plasmid) [Marinobacter adhaerens HP15]|uniref:Uncharacterized protein n=1 Tax=Marinobacter adhaerens (strain DSM 23420 / HP15) TaxID=225937 RepID=E4PRY2_MARAH|nr:hypothetical protein HP15_p187g20 [Marinobacter adhaerens HP15]
MSEFRIIKGKNIAVGSTYLSDSGWLLAGELCGLLTDAG